MYSKYETVRGLPSESATYLRLLEHLRLGAECCYTIGHMRKANDNLRDQALGQGWLKVGEMLERMTKHVAELVKGRLN